MLVEAETVNRVFEALDLWLDISNSPHFLADSQVVPQKAGSLFILMLNKEDLFDQKIEQEARPRLAHIISYPIVFQLGCHGILKQCWQDIAPVFNRYRAEFRRIIEEDTGPLDDAGFVLGRVQLYKEALARDPGLAEHLPGPSLCVVWPSTAHRL